MALSIGASAECVGWGVHFRSPRPKAWKPEDRSHVHLSTAQRHPIMTSPKPAAQLEAACIFSPHRAKGGPRLLFRSRAKTGAQQSVNERLGHD